MKCQKCGEEIIDFIFKDREEALNHVVSIIMGFDITSEDLEDII